MSFSKKVKEELTTIPAEIPEFLAEMSAFLHLNSEIATDESIKSINFKTKNPTVAIRFFKMLKVLYPADTKLLIEQEKKLKKQKQITITITSQIDKILTEHGLKDDNDDAKINLTKTDKQKSAYLRGAFLAAGSINSPHTAEYHLEIYSDNPNEAIFIQNLMNNFDFNAKITKRRKGYIVYLKEAEKISDFLKLTEAQNSLFDYEDIRIKRDFNNSINRVINCELANEKKAQDAARKQLDDIYFIERCLGKDTFNRRLMEVVELRKEFPTAALSELEERYFEKYQTTISKSGLNHRFLKIKEIRSDFEESMKNPH